MLRFLLVLAFCAGCSSQPDSENDGAIAVTSDLGEENSADLGLESDSAVTSGAGPATTDLATADLAPAPSDLACFAFIADPVQESPCMPGQTRHSYFPPACYERICGCTDKIACSNCYWSTWRAVACP